MVIVDPLKLVQGSRRENRNRELADYSRQLKLLQRALGIPVITTHHLSDKAIAHRSDKRPKPADLYETGHLDKDADIVIGIHRDDYWDKGAELAGIMELLFQKGRIGNVSGQTIQLFFSSRHGSLLDAETRQQPIDTACWQNGI